MSGDALNVNEFLGRGGSQESPRLGIIRHLSPEEKAWGILKGSPEVIVLRHRGTFKSGVVTVRALNEAARYIGRRGGLELEDEDGVRYRGLEEAIEAVSLWDTSFSRASPAEPLARKIVLGAPDGGRHDAFEEAVRGWAAEHLAGRPYIAAFHYDTNEPHAHIIYRLRGFGDSRILNITDPDIQPLREDFASRLLERGIEANATRRFTRGLAGYAAPPEYRKKGPELEGRRRLSPLEKEKLAAVALYARDFIERLEKTGDMEKKALARGLRGYYRDVFRLERDLSREKAREREQGRERGI